MYVTDCSQQLACDIRLAEPNGCVTFKPDIGITIEMGAEATLLLTNWHHVKRISTPSALKVSRHLFIA